MSPEEIITIGKNFNVAIYDDYVIKVPKRDQYKDPKKMQYIAQVQTYLSQHIDGVLPCKFVKDHLEMPRAKGVRLDIYKEENFRMLNKGPFNVFQEHAEKLKMDIQDQIDKLGYYNGDSRDVNLFYDKQEDKLYFIDFSEVKEKSVYQKGLDEKEPRRLYRPPQRHRDSKELYYNPKY